VARKKKPIRFSAHAREQLRFRGASEAEVVEAIRTAKWQTAKSGRLECRKDFIFKKIWNNKFYPTKQVRPVFVEEKKEIVVITVYTYFF
jgi:hypothetical protein